MITCPKSQQHGNILTFKLGHPEEEEEKEEEEEAEEE